MLKLISIYVLSGMLALVSVPAHASNFLFGMVVGMSMENNKKAVDAGLASIPLRCLMAENEVDYKACRYPSMRTELQQARIGSELMWSLCGADWSGHQYSRGMRVDQQSVPEKACDINFHLDMEIAALRQLDQIMASAAASQ